jgi:shikimate kinase
MSFVDADEEIERAAGKPITDIFKDHGEPYFRDWRAPGDRAPPGRRTAGAGDGRWAFMVAETRENIRRSGISVWLKAELPLLMRPRAQEEQPAAADERSRGVHEAADDGAATPSTRRPTSPWKAARFPTR